MKIGDRVKVANLNIGDTEGFEYMIGEQGTISYSAGHAHAPKHHVQFDKSGIGVWTFFPSELELL
jgi:hypothetical protein